MDFKAQKARENEECVFNAHETRSGEGGSAEPLFKAAGDVRLPKPKIPSPRVPFVLSESLFPGEETLFSFGFLTSYDAT